MAAHRHACQGRAHRGALRRAGCGGSRCYAGYSMVLREHAHADAGCSQLPPAPPLDLAEAVGIPFGMRRLRIGDFVLSAQKDKLVLTQRDKPSRHLTVHLGEKSGFIDVHLTRDRAGSRTRHRTLFRLSRRLVARVLQGAIEEISRRAPDPLQFVRRLRPGWIFRRRWVAVHLAYAGRDNPLDRLAHRERKGRARVGARAILRAMSLASSRRELLRFPQGAFLVVSRNLPNGFVPLGVGLKVDRVGERPLFLWVRMSDLVAFSSYARDLPQRLLDHGIHGARVRRAARR